MSVARKSSLSPARCRLLELMQSIGFGRIENMIVRGGEPVFRPPPYVVREFKLTSDDDADPAGAAADFELKAQVVRLFRRLDKLGDGLVEMLEVKDGLPFKLVIEGVEA
jgi:hypothetical protein